MPRPYIESIKASQTLYRNTRKLSLIQLDGAVRRQTTLSPVAVKSYNQRLASGSSMAARQMQTTDGHEDRLQYASQEAHCNVGQPDIQNDFGPFGTHRRTVTRYWLA
jgi:hypothetical protein